MKNRLATAIAAAALAVTTSLPAPAMALDRAEQNALTLLLGITALGLVLDDKDNKRPQTVNRNNAYGWNGYDDRYYRPKKDHRVIPAQCIFPVRGSRGRTDVVAGRCVADFGMTRRLPRECAFDIRDGRRDLTVYGVRCLSRNGYRIAERRGGRDWREGRD